MAPRKLSLADAENIATRGKAWTLRLEFHGTTANGNPSAKFWYATGRAFHEAIEIGWGAIGALPQNQLIDWTEFRTRVADKLSKGYDYALTDFVRMSAASLANLTGSTPAPQNVPAKAAPVPVAAPVAPPPPPTGAKYTKTPSASLLTLGEPYSLIRALKMQRNGTVVTGYTALDETGDALLTFDTKGGVEFATLHDVEVEF